MHSNWETSLRVCNLTEFDTQHHLLQDWTKTDSVIMLQQKHKVFPTALTVMIDFLPQTKVSILFCNNSKDPSTLSKSISTRSQPSTNFPPPSPSRHPISTPHLSFMCVPPHQLVFIPCPLQNSVPALDLSYWLRADPAKKQRRSFGFNYSCVMRGSGFSPLQAKKKGLLQ